MKLDGECFSEDRSSEAAHSSRVTRSGVARTSDHSSRELPLAFLRHTVSNPFPENVTDDAMFCPIRVRTPFKHYTARCPMSPHKWRHFLFTWLKKEGIDDALIQPYSGHTT